MKACTHLCSYYSEKTKSLLSGIEEVKTSLSKGQVHKLRVDIKGVKNILRFIEFINPESFNGKGYYKPFKAVFRWAGKLREIQLNIQYFKQYSHSHLLNKAFIKLTEAEEKKAKKKLKKVLAGFNSKKVMAIEKDISHTIGKLTENTIIMGLHNSINTDVAEIKKLLSATVTTAKLHAVRKHLKSLYITSSFLYKVEPGVVVKKNLPVIKKAEVAIGEWHDKVVLLGFLKTLPLKYKAELMPIEGIIRKENKVLISEIKRCVLSISPLLVKH